jgi:hypothetical protein
MLFVDAGVPGEVEQDDTVLHFSEPVPDDIQLTSASFNNYISYFSDGTTNNSGSFEFCNTGDDSAVQSICISMTGRVITGAEECRVEEVTCL